MAAALALTLGILSVGRTYLGTPHEVVAQVPDGRFAHLVWTVTLSIMGICLTGAVIGAMLPLFIKWVGGDPALMSSPFIATLSDVLGIVIYFNIVAMFFL
jgi:magnesium transporter